MLRRNLPAAVSLFVVIMAGGCAGVQVDGPGPGQLPDAVPQSGEGTSFGVPQTGEYFHTTDDPLAPSNGFWGKN